MIYSLKMLYIYNYEYNKTNLDKRIKILTI